MQRLFFRSARKFILDHFSVNSYLSLNRWVIPFFKSRHLEFDIFLHLLSKEKKKISFIQIGASDGVTNDPIYKFVRSNQWNGLLIEPLPHVFQELKQNYDSQEGLVFLNVAVSDSDKNLDLFYLPQEYVNEEWQKQLASFDRRAIEFNLRNHQALFEKIATMKVPCLDLKAIGMKYTLKELDLILIDVEGHEYKILSQLNQLKQKPKYIYYEKGTMAKGDLVSLRAFLQGEKYILYNAGGDELAVKK